MRRSPPAPDDRACGRSSVRRRRPGVERLEGRTLLTSFTGAVLAGPVASGVRDLVPGAPVVETLGPGGVASFVLTATAGRLTATATSGGFPLRLELLGPQGRPLVQSDGGAPRGV